MIPSGQMTTLEMARMVAAAIHVLDVLMDAHTDAVRVAQQDVTIPVIQTVRQVVMAHANQEANMTKHVKYVTTVVLELA